MTYCTFHTCYPSANSFDHLKCIQHLTSTTTTIIIHVDLQRPSHQPPASTLSPFLFSILQSKNNVQDDVFFLTFLQGQALALQVKVQILHLGLSRFHVIWLHTTLVTLSASPPPHLLLLPSLHPHCSSNMPDTLQSQIVTLNDAFSKDSFLFSPFPFNIHTSKRLPQGFTQSPPLASTPDLRDVPSPCHFLITIPVCLPVQYLSIPTQDS